MGIGTKEQIVSLCLRAIHNDSSSDKEIISAYRKYRELSGLSRYAEWNYYSDDPKMQKAMYLSLLDELEESSRNLHTT